MLQLWFLVIRERLNGVMLLLLVGIDQRQRLDHHSLGGVRGRLPLPQLPPGQQQL